MKQIKPEEQVSAISAPRSQHAASSSSSWEGPISDSQAVPISDYLLTDQEAEIYLSEQGVNSSDAAYNVLNQGPSTNAYEQLQDDLGEQEEETCAPSWEIEIPPECSPLNTPET